MKSTNRTDPMAERESAPSSSGVRAGREGTARRRAPLAALLPAAGTCLLALWALSAQEARQDGAKAPTIAETRVAMDKWIETQQLLARERKDWQQGKEILLGRLEILRNEVSGLEKKIEEANASVVEAEKKRDELKVEEARLAEIGTRLTTTVTGMEGDVRKLLVATPQPVVARIETLSQRIPEDPATTKVVIAERFQSVIGILNELNKANNEITVAIEVRTLEGGKPAEVQSLYLGLAQGYYVSPAGDAGIGRPSLEGWTWKPSKAIAGSVLSALEIIQGKQSPAFVPLPVTIQ